ncbi:MAG: imidazolonepropionase [Verrucomicrobiota bacterium]
MAGAFTGKGFVENDGRRPTISQADFHQGPVDLAICDATREVIAIGKNLTVGTGETILSGQGKVAMPGWLDSHTHAIYAGNRASEFFRRWEGRSYLEIARAGGGISVTKQKTAEMDDAELSELLAQRFRQMLACGTVATEVKSGYGRNAKEEARLLRLISQAASKVPEMRVVSTFLGLHSIPAERSEREFVSEMIDVLPLIKSLRLASFVDSFPEKGFFSLDESLRFSEAAAKLGFGLKAHADELTDSGSSLAFIERGATSIDHLQNISDAAISALASSSTVATVLPATSFYLGLSYANARKLIKAGAKVALATDFNPGTAPSYRLQFTSLLAAANLRMTAAEILCALTFNAASALRIDQEYGAITPGKTGTILLFSASNNVNQPQDLLEHLLLNGAGLTVRLSAEGK